MAFATVRIIDKNRKGEILYEACFCAEHAKTEAPHNLSELEVTAIPESAMVPCSCAGLAPELRWPGYVDCAAVHAAKAAPMLALLIAGAFMVACSGSPTAPTAPHVAQIRWNLVGLGNPTVAALGVACVIQPGTPISMGPAIVNVRITDDTLVTQWHTVEGRDVSAIFTLTGEDFGLCAWGWAQ